jgi:nitric oxide reductase large subunit
MTADLFRSSTQQLSVDITGTGTLGATFGFHQYLAADFTGSVLTTAFVNINKVFTTGFDGTGTVTLAPRLTRGFSVSFSTTANMAVSITDQVVPGWKASYARNLNKLVTGELEL